MPGHQVVHSLYIPDSLGFLQHILQLLHVLDGCILLADSGLVLLVVVAVGAVADRSQQRVQEELDDWQFFVLGHGWQLEKLGYLLAELRYRLYG